MTRSQPIATLLTLLVFGCEPDPVQLERTPVAFAGFDRTALVGERITLDGSGSRDPDGDLLDFRWTLILSPPGSIAGLESATSKQAILIPDLRGVYIISLAVFDGALRASDLLALTILNPDESPSPSLKIEPERCIADINALEESPCADKEADRLTLSILSGDEVSEDALLIDWTMLKTPPGIDATQLGLEPSEGLASVSQPFRFIVQRPGEYWISATAQDDRSGLSGVALATVSVLDGPRAERPRAQISAPRSVQMGEIVLFDGRDSVVGTATTAPLQRRWTLVTDPSLGQDRLTDNATGCPTNACRRLVPSAPGIYIVGLEVSQGAFRGASALFALEVQP